MAFDEPADLKPPEIARHQSNLSYHSAAEEKTVSFLKLQSAAGTPASIEADDELGSGDSDGSSNDSSYHSSSNNPVDTSMKVSEEGKEDVHE